MPRSTVQGTLPAWSTLMISSAVFFFASSMQRATMMAQLPLTFSAGRVFTRSSSSMSSMLKALQKTGK